MCTALSVLQQNHYFGRTLDYELSFNEKITIIPRHYPLRFSGGEIKREHYALIGMAAGEDNYPLYYDAMNEKGLAMAGLLFAGNAYYQEPLHGMENVASFECIPWVLSRCSTVMQAKKSLSQVRLTNIPFRKDMPPSPLHWILADKEHTIVAEPLQDGLRIYDNPVGVLANNPTFDYHLLRLTDFMSLRNTPPENNMYSKVPLHSYSRGMGAFGLPGDFSSSSRFVRAVFGKANIANGISREDEIAQFFRILRTVEVPRGYVVLDNGKQVMTVYTSCCDTKNGVYYCTSYEDSTIRRVDMHTVNLEDDTLFQYSLPRRTLIQSL